MFSLTFGIFLLGLTASAHCFIDHSESDIKVNLGRESRALGKGFNLFDVLKKLDICYLQCKDKYCECCQKIKILLKIPVCATVDFTPAEKIAQIGLKVSGLKLVSTKVKLERRLCRSITSKIGLIDVCVDTQVLGDEQRKNSFPVCFKFQVSYEGTPSALLTFGCSDSSVTTNEQASGEYNSVASLKVLNGDQVAKAIKKIADGSGKKS
ncbi:uncharacterized protein [Halyomorpha halys]|uniref:uncharacterized protein n=1 Tax=Halyomorpha halys TaxID=286706 RepID=UPI0006D51153|nr:uncharacterized protein LOC106685433 [Halyomorpha halys]